MPTLKDLVCHVQWPDTGSPFPEYGTQYGDGVVETYIAIPSHPQAFTIRLTSRQFIFEGLAMVVFIDGDYQCNRNRVNLQPPKNGLPRNRTEIDFLVRQQEKPMGDGAYMGREWRFDDYNIVSELPQGVNENHFDNLGTIEVLVLRCRSDTTDEARMTSSSSGEDSAVLGDSENVQEVKISETDKPSQKNDKRETHAEAEAAPEGDGFFGLFDGPSDQPAFPYGYPGDGPPTFHHRWSSRHLDAHPAPYGAQEGPSHPPSYYAGSAFHEDPYRPPHDYQPSPAPAHLYPGPGLQKADRRVHFDYGDQHRLSGSNIRYDNHFRTLSQAGYRGADGYGRPPPAPAYQHSTPHRGVNPYADDPSPVQGRHYMYNAEQKVYSDYPDTYQGYGKYPPRSPIPDPPQPQRFAVPPLHPGQPIFHNTGAPPVHHAMNQLQPVPPHPPGAAPAWFPGHAQPVHHPFPVWIPPPAVPIPSSFAGPVPIYPPPNNASLFHAQGPTSFMAQAPHLGAEPAGDASTHPQGQPATGPSQQSGSSDPAKETNNTSSNTNGPEAQVPPKDADNNTGENWATSAAGNGADGKNDAAHNDGGWDTENNNTGDDGSGKGNDDNNKSSWSDDNNKNSGGNDNAANDNSWDNDTTAKNDGWDQQNQNSSGNQSGNTQNGIWANDNPNGNAQTNDGWANDDQKDKSGNSQPVPGGWENDQNNASHPNSASIPAASQASLRALYGPHGAYYTPRIFAENTIPPDAEEGPRYDVPRAIAQTKGTSKQVQPGKGYMYNKKRCVPEYIDNLDEPYGRFVFKYRTKEQIRNEIGVEIGIEPTANEDVNSLENLDKAELIRLVLRAKNALGGTIPDQPVQATAATPTSAASFEQVAVTPPARCFLRYSLPPARNVSNGTGLGIRMPKEPGKQDTGDGGDAKQNNEWSKSTDSWDNNRQQNTNSGAENWNEQSNRNANTNKNASGWDGQQEKEGASSTSRKRHTQRSERDQPPNPARKEAQPKAVSQTSRQVSSQSLGTVIQKSSEPVDPWTTTASTSAVDANGGAFTDTNPPSAAAAGGGVSANQGTSYAPQPYDYASAYGIGGGGAAPPPAQAQAQVNFVGEGVVGGAQWDTTLPLYDPGPRPPTPDATAARPYAPQVLDMGWGESERPDPVPVSDQTQMAAGGWGNAGGQPSGPTSGW